MRQPGENFLQTDLIPSGHMKRCTTIMTDQAYVKQYLIQLHSNIHPFLHKYDADKNRKETSVQSLHHLIDSTWSFIRSTRTSKKRKKKEDLYWFVSKPTVFKLLCENYPMFSALVFCSLSNLTPHSRQCFTPILIPHAQVTALRCRACTRLRVESTPFGSRFSAIGLLPTCTRVLYDTYLSDACLHAHHSLQHVSNTKK